MQGIHPGFEAQSRCHQKSKTGVSVAPLMSSRNLIKNQTFNSELLIVGSMVPIVTKYNSGQFSYATKPRWEWWRPFVCKKGFGISVKYITAITTIWWNCVLLLDANDPVTLTFHIKTCLLQLNQKLNTSSMRNPWLDTNSGMDTEEHVKNSSLWDSVHYWPKWG